MLGLAVSSKRRRSADAARRPSGVRPRRGRAGDLRPAAPSPRARAASRPAVRLRGAGSVRGDGSLLAAVAVAVHLPGPVARDRPALGARAQAAHLRPDRARSSPRRRAACPRSSAASATGTTATRGSATRRSRSTRSCASASPTRRGASWTGSRRAAAKLSGDAPLQIVYGIDGRSDLTESSSITSTGYRGSRPVRIGNGAVRPAPARHLRRADGLGVPLQQVRDADLVRPLGRSSGASSTGSATTGNARTRASGRRAAVSSTSSIRS